MSKKLKEFAPRERVTSGLEFLKEPKRYILYESISKNNYYWLVGDVPNSADYIFAGSPTHKERGFAGRAITFKIKQLDPIDPPEITLLGPFHEGSVSLYIDTMIDIRRKHLTWGLLALEYDKGTYRKIIYHDPLDFKGEIGSYDRIETMAQAEADKRGCRVYYYAKSAGGSIKFSCTPKEVKNVDS